MMCGGSVGVSVGAKKPTNGVKYRVWGCGGISAHTYYIFTTQYLND